MPELAIPTVKLLHEKDPDDADIAIYLAGLYRHGGDCNNAMSVLDRQLRLGDAAAARRINIERALTLHKSGDTTEAHKVLASLVRNDPNDTFVPLAETAILKDEQKWNELTGYINQWHQNHPRSTHIIVAVLKNLSADPNNDAKLAAERIARNAIIINQNSPELINEFAGLLYVSGRFSEAAEQYRQLLKINPNDLTAMNNLAWILCENTGEPAKALEMAQKGLHISPDYLDLLDTRGIAYFRLGNLDRAIDDFTRCTKLYPGNTPAVSAAYFHLGRAFAAAEKKRDAVEYLKMALESNQKIGGLSADDVTETQNLLDKLLKG